MPRTISTILQIRARKKLENIGKVILVGSGKGGVGKSFVASGLALTLSANKYRTGILDLDIHGASLPNYLGVKPPVKSGKNGLKPKRAVGGRLEVMSLALFTGEKVIPIHGEKKGELISQLFSLTDWGELDYLVVDLPPGTGDEVLSAFEIFADGRRGEEQQGRGRRSCSLLLVTTPAPNAVSVVSRLRQLAQSEKVPIQGIVVNMAYVGQGKKKKIKLFGAVDPKILEERLASSIITDIPFEPKVNTQNLLEILKEEGHNGVSRAFDTLAENIIKT